MNKPSSNIIWVYKTVHDFIYYRLCNGVFNFQLKSQFFHIKLNSYSDDITYTNVLKATTLLFGVIFTETNQLKNKAK